jgi:predicted dehydrogenase
MPADTYRAVLAGTGGIAEAHARAIAATRGRVQLLAAMDVDEPRARAFATRHQVPAVFTDYARLLRETRPDLVVVASPPATHLEMCVAAMEAGAWVWCEKPLCGSLADFDALAAAEQRTGRFTACVLQMRFASSTEHLRVLAASGRLGRPLVAVGNTLWYRDAAYYAVPWRGTWASAFGGPTMTLGIHTMDHLLHLLGDWREVRAVAATLDRAIEIEDVSAALVTLASGAIATCLNSALSPRQETYLRIDYQFATVELTHLYSYSRENWRFTPGPGPQAAGLLAAWQEAPPDVGSTHEAQLADLVRHLDAGTRPHTTGAGSRRTLELLTAIYKSAATGEIVRAGSIQPGDRFYSSVHGGAPL